MSTYRYGQPAPNAYPVQVTMDEAYETHLAVVAGSEAADTIDKAAGTALRNAQTDEVASGSTYDQDVRQSTREAIMGLRRTNREAPGTLYPLPRAVGNVIMHGLTIMEEGDKVVVDADKGIVHNNAAPNEIAAAKNVLEQIGRQEDDIVDQELQRLDRVAQAEQRRKQDIL
jgi:hypothetical protein